MGEGDWDGVEQRLLFHDEVIAVAAPHFNHGQLPQTPQQIVDSPIIHSTESWLPWCEAAGVEMSGERAGLCSNDSNLILEAVRLGQGIALERRSLVQDAIARGELVQLGDIQCALRVSLLAGLAAPRRFAHQAAGVSQWLFKEVDSYLGQLKGVTDKCPPSAQG